MSLEIKDFILKIEDEFEDLPKGILKPETKFRDIMEWNSVNALIFIALVNSEYDVVINAPDFEKSKTVSDLFNIIKSRTN